MVEKDSERVCACLQVCVDESVSVCGHVCAGVCVCRECCLRVWLVKAFACVYEYLGCVCANVFCVCVCLRALSMLVHACKCEICVGLRVRVVLLCVR